MGQGLGIKGVRHRLGLERQLALRLPGVWVVEKACLWLLWGLLVSSLLGDYCCESSLLSLKLQDWLFTSIDHHSHFALLTVKQKRERSSHERVDNSSLGQIAVSFSRVLLQ